MPGIEDKESKLDESELCRPLKLLKLENINKVKPDVAGHLPDFTSSFPEVVQAGAVAGV